MDWVGRLECKAFELEHHHEVAPVERNDIVVDMTRIGEIARGVGLVLEDPPRRPGGSAAQRTGPASHVQSPGVSPHRSAGASKSYRPTIPGCDSEPLSLSRATRGGRRLRRAARSAGLWPERPRLAQKRKAGCR